jgi:hypothetical protein
MEICRVESSWLVWVCACHFAVVVVVVVAGGLEWVGPMSSILSTLSAATVSAVAIAVAFVGAFARRCVCFSSPLVGEVGQV